MFMPSGVIAAGSGETLNFQEYVLTAGQASSDFGYLTAAVVPGPAGSLSPGTAYNPANGASFLLGLVSNFGNINIYFQPTSLPDIDQHFSFLSITGDFQEGFENLILARVDRDTYVTNDDGETRWSWTSIPSKNFVLNNVYDVVLRWEI